MNTTTHNESAVKNTIDSLIQAGTTFDIDALERLYHDSMVVLTIDQDGQLMIADKAAFKGLFESKLATNSAPLNTWARYEHIQANDETAHVLITRKVNLIDQDQLLTLSIDLVFQNDRWQVTREVIFARPDESETA